MNRKHTELKTIKQRQEFTQKFLEAIYDKKHRDIADNILCKFYFYDLNFRELEIFHNAKYFTLWSKQTGRVVCKTLYDLFIEAEKLNYISKIIFYACQENADCQFGWYEHKLKTKLLNQGVLNAR